MIVFVEPCDYEAFPPGGTLSSARLVLKSFGQGFALVGIATDDTTPIGCWCEKELYGRQFPFFATGRWEVTPTRPLIPGRLRFYLELQRWRREILSLGCTDAYVQTAEALFAASQWPVKRIAFRFAGVENSLRISRYPWARVFADVYEQVLFRALGATDVILASASEKAILDLCARSKGRLSRERINAFPTVVDTDLFQPVAPQIARASLGVPSDWQMIVVNGRVHKFKGWKLLLDSLKAVLRERPRAHMCFVGDGSDRPSLEAYAEFLGIRDHVTVTGFQPPRMVAAYLNCADVMAVGSLAEGWSHAMLEGLACGKAIVSTDVSGARELIADGLNGYVIADRDDQAFSAALDRAFDLPHAALISRGVAERYSCELLPRRLALLWKPFAEQCENDFEGRDL